MTALTVATVPPVSGQPPEGAIVMLHGWGASAQDVLALSKFINLPTFQFVFPDAPFPHPYAANGKMWYDLSTFKFAEGFHDRADLTTSRQGVIALLQLVSEQTGLPLSRILLGGFSQGGAMTLDVGLSLPLAGLLVLSGYLHAPIDASIPEFPPILVVHGRQDTVVPLSAAHQVRDRLQALGAKLRYLEYDMGHEIQPIVLEQIQVFAEQVVAS